MTAALVVICCLFLIREVMHSNDQVRWQKERQDLYNRIQAGTLQEYQASTKTPSKAIVKDREQKIAEQCEQQGLQRSDFQYPPIWKV